MFYQPTFISLDKTAKPNNIPVKGIRIGINGTVPRVGQAYIPLNTSVTSSAYTAQGQVLSNIGTVIALQSGPQTDQFFLTFDQLGSQKNVVVEPVPATPPPSPGPIAADIGVRTFAQVNSTLSRLTGVPTTNPAVRATYLAVQQQLPANPTLEGFSSSHQIGIAQLAIQYCNVMVKTPAYASSVLPGVIISGSLYPAGASTVTTALAARLLGSGLNSQPSASTVTAELGNLITALCNTSSCSITARAQAVTAAACATAFGSADMLIN
jgi:hypothetical protein